jgi:hypothetical protein
MPERPARRLRVERLLLVDDRVVRLAKALFHTRDHARCSIRPIIPGARWATT